MYKTVALIAIFIKFVVANARYTPPCGYEQYRVKGEGTCRQCPVCKEGYGLNECRSDIIYDPKKQPTCLPCIDGQTFSSHNGSGPCDLCSPIDKDQREKEKCTRFKDRVTECKLGYFENGGHHQCSQQCCYCGKTKKIAKCVQDNVSDGRFCAPTRWDGKCDLKPQTTPVTTTKASSKSSKPFVPSTNTPRPIDTSTKFSNSTSTANSSAKLSTESSSVSTTSRPTLPRPTIVVPTVPSVKTEPTPFPTKNITSPTEVPIQNPKTPYGYIIVIVLLVIGFVAILCVFLGRRYSECCSDRDEGNEKYGSMNPINHYTRVTDSLVSSENSSVRSSRVVEGEVAGSQDLLLTAIHNGNALRMSPPPNVEPDYAVCGCHKLSSLRHSQRMKLGTMLDTKIKGLWINWRDLGMYLAKGNKILQRAIDNCHECYYGGGNATLHLFDRLELAKPDLTVAEFIKTSRILNRLDVIRYLSDKPNISLFKDILYEQKQYIASLLERRVENGRHYWPSFAEKLLGLSSEEIDAIQRQKIIPQKHSPTMEMINVLCAHKPGITVEEFQEAAVVLGHKDVIEYLGECMRNTITDEDV